MRAKLFVALLLITALPASAYADKLKVVASFSILGDMVHQVGGDYVEVATIVGPDGDAHTYEPTPADAKTIADADLIIVNGLGFEGWLDKLIKSAGYKGKVIVASKNVTPIALEKTQDPHAWQSVANAEIYATNICDALMAADRKHKYKYRKNGTHYLQQLDELDIWVKKEIEKIPQEKRKVITTHDAFGYFARDYGVQFIAPIGVSTESEASAADIAKIIDQIRAGKVRALFMENMTDPRLIKQLKTDSHAYVGGTLYSDALSPPDGPAPDYISLFHHNVDELTKGMMINQ